MKTKGNVAALLACLNCYRVQTERLTTLYSLKIFTLSFFPPPNYSIEVQSIPYFSAFRYRWLVAPLIDLYRLFCGVFLHPIPTVSWCVSPSRARANISSSTDLPIFFHRCDWGGGFLDAGVAHEYGLGVNEDPKEAARWHFLAAAQGLAESNYHLGLMKVHGRGFSQDFGGAAIHFQKVRFGILMLFGHDKLYGGIPTVYASWAWCKKKFSSKRLFANIESSQFVFTPSFSLKAYMLSGKKAH